MAGKDLKGLVKFFHLVGRLKVERRQGWVDRGVKDSESVADHSFRLALMAMAFAERQELDSCKAVKLSLVHDLAEAVVGDVVTRPEHERDLAWQAEKHAREEKALKKILEKVDGALRKEFWKLWQEYEARNSEEAKLVYELDRLEAVFQAQEYASEKRLRARLKVFFDYGNSRLENKELKEVFGLVLEELEQV